MKVGLVGLGRMGSGIAKCLVNDGHEVVILGRDEKVLEQAKEAGATGTSDIEEFTKKLPSPHIIWLMIPPTAVDEILDKLEPYLSKEDIIIDGGNSFFKDSIKRADKLKEKGIYFLDAGTSGGLIGSDIGYCIMVGGDEIAFQTIEPMLKSLAIKDGYSYIGKSGSGHFAKMVHNGIEYGMMQSIGEGLELIKESNFDIDLKNLAKLWNNGSIIRGHLMDLTHKSFEKHPNLEDVLPYAEETGEGRWAVETAIESKVPLTTIAHALFSRYESQKNGKRFAMKVVAALREQFGGHDVKKK